ncbi:MAG: hypothetical protein COT74_03855 [Bdellovibrionales bacterium CG10_big_fil_rev_8_21_14_0_10_45_34]|nr:MAG: hypothetical protein COT74_03855 [Bdellovibrionales bacterium CG10_big_fil_rev_8_21_14_0_10_45_34]
MGAFGLLQILIDIVLCLSLLILWKKYFRLAAKDDPRLSRGLQILQSKIAVLEDLSDRTEHQVRQLSLLLDEKSKEVQERIESADRHIDGIRRSIQKSLEVAKIFEDKIPHAEVVERQNTQKYLDAAKMAHAGESVDAIAAKVALPKNEIEIIVKIHKDRSIVGAHENTENDPVSQERFVLNQPDNSFVEDSKSPNT